MTNMEITPTLDLSPLINALAVFVIALSVAVPGYLAYLNSKAALRKTEELSEKTDAVMNKVDGNYSALKEEVASGKNDVIEANQRIAVLIERLITSTPAPNHSSITPVTVVNPNPIPVEIDKGKK